MTTQRAGAFSAGLLGALLAVLLGAAASAQECPQSYTVARGDTLSAIADRFLGDRRRYAEIYSANRSVIGPNPALIEVGTVLSIPCSGAGAATAAVPTPTPSAAVPGEWGALMTVAELAVRRPTRGLQILDVRPAAAAGEGYIPGARSAPFEEWRAPAADGGAVPDERTLSDVIGAAGIDTGRPIVIVAARLDAASLGRAAWVYWLLKSVGARQIAIMEGGFEGWRESGQPVVRRPARVRTRRVAVTYAAGWPEVQSEILRITAGEAPGAVLDAHPDRFFATVGEGSASGGRAAAILEILKSEPVDWERRTVVFTSPDMLAGAAAWFYASEVAGIRNVRFYPAPHSG